MLPVPLTVQVLDAGGRGLKGVTVEWLVTRGGGSLVARSFPTVTDTVGLALVFWQLGSVLDSQSVAAVCCSAGVTQANFTAQALLPFAQRLSIVSGSWQTDTVTRTLAAPIVAWVRRADGTPGVGAIVAWGTQNPGGQFSPGFVHADSTGRASTTWTLGTTAGTQTGTAIVRGLPPAVVTATALAGQPVRLAIAPNSLPTLGAVGDQVGVNVQGWDRYGNLAVAYGPITARDTNIAQVNGTWVTARHHGSTWLTAQIGALHDSVLFTVLGFTAATEGYYHVCGLSLAGDAYCWGENAQGAVGDGTTTYRPDPVLIARGLGLQVPFTYVHTCALTAAGMAYCWGGNQSGELGNGSPTYATDQLQPLPVAVAGGHVFSSVRPGRNHTCALATNGVAYCWGANEYGQLGRDTLTNTCSVGPSNRCSDWPILVAGGLTFTQVSAGRFKHTCGLTSSGAAYCWGLNDWGELGNASSTPICSGIQCSYAPLLVAGGLSFKSVQAGSNYSCGVAVTGDGYCWGYGAWGSLGNGSTAPTTVPAKVAGGLSFAVLQAGWATACGLTTGEKLYCWGGNYPGVPTPVLPSVQFTALAVGGGEGDPHAGCALTVTNDLYCF